MRWIQCREPTPTPTRPNSRDSFTTNTLTPLDRFERFERFLVSDEIGAEICEADYGTMRQEVLDPRPDRQIG